MAIATSSGLVRFFGSAISGGAGYAMGAATAPALRPLLQELTNLTWGLHPVRPPDAGTLASGVAQGQVDPGDAAVWAAQQGIGATAFKALVEIANTGPGVPAAFDLWRRGVIDEPGFRRAVKRQGVEPEWINDFIALKTERLDPAVIATAIQRGIMHDPGFLPVGPPSAAGVVKPFPVSPLDTLVEAAAHGIDEERLFVQTAIVGLPASPDLAARMTFRKIIEKVDFDRAISEGNTRNEWADVLFEGFRAIPTARDGIEGRLRGWITDAEMYAQTARHGMSKADTDLLFKVSGRPITNRQVFIGLRRGGVYDGPTTQIAAPFLKSLQESNIRPEWYNLAWAQRHTLPSAFVLRALTNSGDLTAVESENLLLDIGWPEDLAKKVATRWALGKAAGAKEATKTDLLTEYEGLYITEADVLAALTALGYDAAQAQIEIHLSDARRVKKARDQAVEAIHKSYVKHKIQRAEAATLLGVEAIPEPALGLILAQWDIELSAERAALTVAQIVRAYKRSVITRAEALAELEERGYSAADAATLLDSSEPAPPQAPLP